MVYRSKRRVMRKRRAPRRYGRRRVIRRNVPNVHRFKEMYQLPSLAASPTSSTYGVITSNLNGLTNAASIKSMFDLYKITGIKYTFLYRANIADTQGAGSGASGLPLLYLATNRDPFVPAPTGVPDILNDDTCKVYRLGTGNGKISWYVKAPKPDMSAEAIVPGGPNLVVTQNIQFGVGAKWQPWLTTGGNAQTLDQSGVNHFGVRYVFENLDAIQAQNVQVFATLYFTCKEQD